MTTSTGKTTPNETTDRAHQVPRPRAPRASSERGSPSAPPDLAVTAKEAVIAFLRGAAQEPAGTSDAAAACLAAREQRAAATAEADPSMTHPLAAVAVPPPGIAVPAGQRAGPRDAAQPDGNAATAMRAAAVGVASLDRMESAVAKLEADIAQALRWQAELQAGAGVAAEQAVRAAQEACIAASHAKQASQHVSAALRLVGRYTAIVTAILVIQASLLLLLSVTAS